jgi:hypothetical protein
MPVTVPSSASRSSVMKFSRTSAPAARAASSSTLSSSVRRGLHIMSTPSLVGIRAENAAAP